MSTDTKWNGIAKQLSNKLGVNVFVPSDRLYIYDNGSIVIGSNLLKRWVLGNYLYQERNGYYEKSWFF